jgi:hypothetical protein
MAPLARQATIWPHVRFWIKDRERLTTTMGAKRNERFWRKLGQEDTCKMVLGGRLWIKKRRVMRQTFFANPPNESIRTFVGQIPPHG